MKVESYDVEWSATVQAVSPEAAAAKALQLIVAEIATTFVVTDKAGNQTLVQDADTTTAYKALKEAT